MRFSVIDKSIRAYGHVSYTHIPHDYPQVGKWIGDLGA